VPIADPLEPANRIVWELNQGLLLGVLEPTGRVYRGVVPEPVRTSIRNFSRNLAYPGRVANLALQNRWDEAGTESRRFLTNTSAGVGGLFDPASKWGMAPEDADFGQTFRKWGWKPEPFLMLPMFGPSDPPSALGMAADSAADPKSYLPDPYWIASPISTYNRLAGTTATQARFVRSEPDPYAGIKLAWTYAAKDRDPDWTLRGAPDAATLETLQVAMLRMENQEFAGKARTLHVRMPHTGKKLPVNLWLQKGGAPLAYVVPGLGSHRLSMTPLAVAEFLYQKGYSVVTTSSLFHPEFMERALSSELPGYAANDRADLRSALVAVDAELSRKFGSRLGRRAYIGLSMGGFMGMQLAATDGNPFFDRMIAVNPPINLRHGIAVIDSFNEAINEWPDAERGERIENTAAKISALQSGAAPPPGTVPFDSVETRYLIGYNFRLILRDAVFNIESRNNHGILNTPLSKWNREPVYQEIMGLSYRDYLERFALPHYAAKGIGRDAFLGSASLKTLRGTLSRDQKLRVITNANDFLLAPGDLAWLRSTFGTSRLTVLPSGGHLGTLQSARFRDALLEALDGMR
jgi:ABC-type transporter lipoprotein component MlaA/pimeloyl-ACP methyl ester carboxylesterase